MTGWALAVLVAVCAAVGLWHHRRGAARVARCAHELRGPLGALRLGLDLALIRGSLEPERLRALDLQLLRATVALDELAGWRRPDPRAPLAVGQLLADAVTSLEPLARRRGAELRLAEAPDATVLGDRGRLAQAVGNLIANAIEHGGRRISVSGRVGEGSVRIEVRDDGPGFAAPRRLSRLLRVLGQPPTGEHGHGLAVVSEVAAAHGGRLLSVPTGAGAHIVLKLPLHTRDVLDTAASS